MINIKNLSFRKKNKDDEKHADNDVNAIVKEPSKLDLLNEIIDEKIKNIKDKILNRLLPYHNALNLKFNTKALFEIGFVSFLYGIGFYKRFYMCFVILILLSIVGHKSRYIYPNKDEIFEKEFFNILILINGFLMSGNAYEVALKKTAEQIKSHHQNALIQRDLNNVIKQLNFGNSLIYAIDELGKDYESTFCSVYKTFIKESISSGASQILINSKLIEEMNQHFRLSNEVEEIIYEKKLELSIMAIMPVFIIMMMESFNPSYFNVMYTTLKGMGLMTVFMVILMGNRTLGNKIIYHSLFASKTKDGGGLEQLLPRVSSLTAMLINCQYSLNKSLSISTQLFEDGKNLESLNEMLKKETQKLPALVKYQFVISNNDFTRFINLLVLYSQTGSNKALQSLDYYVNQMQQNYLTNIKKKANKLSVVLLMFLMLSFGIVLAIMVVPLALSPSYTIF